MLNIISQTMDKSQAQQEQCYKLRAKLKLEIILVRLSLVNCFNTIFISLFFLFFSCRGSIQKDSTFQSIGNYDLDSLETGPWEIRDEKGEIIEKGEMLNGVRKGPWIYSLGNDTIVWNEIAIDKLLIRTNLPSFFHLVEEDNQVAIFKPQVPSTDFSIMFGVFDLPDTIDFRVIENEFQSTFSEKKVLIKDSTREIISTSNDRNFLFKKLQGEYLESGKKFGLFGLFGRSGEGKFIEIVVKFELRLIDKARVVFFSIIQNLYINKERLLPLREKIIIS